MSKQTRRAVLGSVALLAGSVPVTGEATAQSAGDGTEWPSFGYDPSNTAHSPAVGPKEPVSAQWTAKTDGAVVSSPAIASGRLFVGSVDNNVYAYHAVNGTLEWTFETGDSVRSSPVVHNGIVFIGSDDSRLYALNAASGTKQWATETGDSVVSAPTVSDDTVYVGSEDNTMYAIDAKSGDVRWRFESGSLITSSPALHEKLLYFGSADANLYALNTATGDVEWRYETNNGVTSSPAIADGAVFIGSSDGRLYALETRTGELRWAFETGSLFGPSPAVAADTVYLSEGIPGTRIHALAVESGERKWTVETNGTTKSSPAVADGVVYVGSSDGHVYAIEAESGETLWTMATDGSVTCSPAVVDGAVYIGSEDQHIYALTDDTIPARIGPNTRQFGEYVPFAVGAVGLGGAGALYFRRRRKSSDSGTPEHSDESVQDPHARTGSGRTHRNQQHTPPEAQPTAGDIPRVTAVAIEYEALTDKQVIGRGGNADVIRAHHPTSTGERTVALKEPRVSGTIREDAVEQLLAEAELWSELDDHDHIVSVLDYDAEPLPWIAMEYMDGGTLTKRAGALPLPQALWTAIAVTKGVRHAHRQGVAHLDLKPENVLFRTLDDAWDVPKVGDWGLSKHLLDHPQSIEGLSPHYAAPEQFDDSFGPTDDITDVYQLGAVFYELFTGHPPFEGRPAAVMQAVVETEPKPPSDAADLPAELDDILLTALAKQRTDRYDDIVYLRDQLRDLYEDMW